MRPLLILAGLLALGSCSETDDPVETARDARKACREAQDKAEQLAGLRKSLNEAPAIPDDIRQAVDDACEASAALADQSLTAGQRAQVDADINAEAIAEAALN